MYVAPRRMTVSVIVPSYNCGHFIAESIDSILAQSRPPEQIIIVDDGSTDDTEQVVRQFKDPRIEYIKQKNGGVSAARNTGLKAARGELVTFLDADDRWRPTFVERMTEFLVANENAVCAFANFVRFNHDTGKVLRDQFSYYPELRQPEPEDDVPSAAARIIPRDRAFRTLVSFNEVPAFTVVMMFRRTLIEGILFDTTLAVCEDTHFALRTFMRGDVSVTSEVLCEVRRHDTNATREYHSIALHKLEALKALAPYVTGESDTAAYRDRLVKAHIVAALHQTRSGYARAGTRIYLGSLRVPGSLMRKVKGAMRMAAALPGAVIHGPSVLPPISSGISTDDAWPTTNERSIASRSNGSHLPGSASTCTTPSKIAAGTR